jgi:hypothetical protein
VSTDSSRSRSRFDRVAIAFQVFHSTQGSQGILGKPSKQQLDTVFHTTNDIDVVKAILEKGKEQSGNGFNSGTGNTNMTRGSFSIDNKGKGLSGI